MSDFEMSNPITPWHMWGSSETVTITPGNENSSVQLARINYHRPETWRLMLVLQSGPLAPGQSVTAQFMANVGIGRASSTIVLSFLFLPTGAGINTQAISTFVATPGIGGLAVGAVPPPMSDVLVAQDISCWAIINGNVGAKVTVAAYFAPNTHIRPDWFSEAQFLGGETGGT